MPEMNFDNIGKEICIREVNENLRRVRQGDQELTRPLAELNRNCHFKEKYEEMFDIWKREEILEEKKNHYKYKNKDKKEYHQKYYKEYCKRPEVIVRNKEYYRSPERIAQQKEYNKLPEVREKRKQYYLKNREQVLKRNKIYTKNNKEKIAKQKRDSYYLKKQQREVKNK